MTPDVPTVKDPYQQAREHGMLLYKAFVLQLAQSYCDREYLIEAIDKRVRCGELNNADTLLQFIKDSVCQKF